MNPTAASGGPVRFVLLSLLVACGSPTTDTDPTTAATATGTSTGTPGTTPATFPPAQGEVVTFDTRDGVTLEADLYTGQAGAPGFVLLHMTPVGGWTRADWPPEFIDMLTTRGWSVVAVDRRGAGGSGGVAEDAFGEPGKYDVEAAVGAVRDAGAGDLAIVGASNGTTAMLDYAIWAPTEGLPEPVALGFMTGGTYTENQNPMTAAPSIPAVFTYSTEEAAWSVAQEGLDPGGWSFLEYPGGDHGTLMFEAKPAVKGDLVDFFDEVL